MLRQGRTSWDHTSMLAFKFNIRYRNRQRSAFQRRRVQHLAADKLPLQRDRAGVAVLPEQPEARLVGLSARGLLNRDVDFPAALYLRQGDCVGVAARAVVRHGT